MPWNIETNDVLIMTPANTPRAYTTRIPIDAIISVEVIAYDAIAR